MAAAGNQLPVEVTTQCDMKIEGGEFQEVSPHFVKDVGHRRANLGMANGAGVIIHQYEIDFTWKYATSGTNPLVIFLGSKVHGKEMVSFMLRFGFAVHVDEFLDTFNRCIDFTEMSDEEKTERNVNSSVQELRPIAPEADLNVNGTIDQAAVRGLLVRGDVKCPKQVYLIRPDFEGAGNFTINTSVLGNGVNVINIAAYIGDNVNNALKPHWRGYPNLAHAPPMTRRTQGDPILSAHRYGFQTPHELRRRREFNVPAPPQPDNDLENDVLANL